MPTWCLNNLTVVGRPEQLEEFMRATRDAMPLSFERLLPVPAELESEAPPSSRDSEKLSVYLSAEERDDWHHWQVLLNESGYSNAYLWRLVKWGTKWDAEEVSTSGLVEFPNSRWPGAAAAVNYAFTTAWNPPMPVIREASRGFSTLVFLLSYIQEDAERSGRAVFVGGEETTIEFQAHMISDIPGGQLDSFLC